MSPIRRYNSAVPLRRLVASVSSLQPLQASTPTTAPDGKAGDAGSNTSSLGESGISSKGSSLLFDDSRTLNSVSAPTTPHMLRRKPPPKPPRLRGCGGSFMGSPRPDMTSPMPTSLYDRTFSRTVSVRSAGVRSLKSSLADVTSVLDVSASSPQSKRHLSESAAAQHDEKIRHIMTQAREMLAHEVDADRLLRQLRERGVINARTEVELRMRNVDDERGMCEMLLDVVASRGEAEFEALCDGLRAVTGQQYLADLLRVLDSLVRAFLGGNVASQSLRPVGGDSGYDSGRNGTDSDNGAVCAACVFNNNDFDNDGEDCSDALRENPEFNVELSYLDTETGLTKTIGEVAALKQAQADETGCDDGRLLAKLYATRFVPVLAVAVYNHCLQSRRRVTTLVDVLERHSCVAELSIVKCHLTADGISLISTALRANRGLTKLDLRLNSIGDDGARQLAEGLRRNPSLRGLNVTSTGLSGEAFVQLLRGLARSPSLTELNIGFNDLLPAGCDVIAECLASNAPLRRLRMRHNSVSPSGAAAIFRSLRRNSRLVSIDISCNAIGNDSVAVLADVLLRNRTLRDVNLENCGVSHAACVALARALKTNSVLHTLDLSMNPVADGGAAALADGLKYNRALETISLNMCDVSNTGFLALLDALRSSGHAVRTLKLCYNRIGPGLPPQAELPAPVSQEATEPAEPAIEVLYASLCNILQLNKDLKVLLWGNKLDDEDVTNQAAPLENGATYHVSV
ncbi:hypothetical protein LSAT2_004152 [Lamellibrachia satsuma]|nr:hypothetical protein LSAT2_004152 [Lamellibrachia satsuma]